MSRRSRSAVLVVGAVLFPMRTPAASAQTVNYFGNTFTCTCASGQVVPGGPTKAARDAVAKKLAAVAEQPFVSTTEADASFCARVCLLLSPKVATPKTSRPSGRSSRRTPTPSVTPDPTAIIQGILGVIEAFSSSDDGSDAAAAAEAEAAREAERVEIERQEQVRREEQQRQFEREKETVLDQMKGVKPGDLQLKGAGSTTTLHFKGLTDVGGSQSGLESAGAQTVPAPTQPSQIRSGWFAEPAAPPPSPEPGFKMPPMIGAGGGTAYSTDSGTIVNVPPGTGQGNTAYSVDTGGVVSAPGLPTPSTTPIAPGGAIGSSGGTAYSTDTGKTVTVAPGTGPTAYSVDTGKVVAAPPLPTPGAQPSTAPQPIQGGGTAYSTDTGKTVAVPSGTNAGVPTGGTGAIRAPSATAFDGKYNTTVVVTTPAGVVAAVPTRSFVLGVVNGAPMANEVLGTIAPTGQLLDGRSQIRLRIGPSATIVIPISGAFGAGGFAVAGSTPCGGGVCTVTVTGAKIP